MAGGRPPDVETIALADVDPMSSAAVPKRAPVLERAAA
jgi:hypothetical protein